MKLKFSQSVIDKLPLEKEGRKTYNDANTRYLSLIVSTQSKHFYYVRKMNGKMLYRKMTSTTYKQAILEVNQITNQLSTCSGFPTSKTLQEIIDDYILLKKTRGDKPAGIHGVEDRRNRFIPESLKKADIKKISTQQLEKLLQSIIIEVGQRSAGMLREDLVAAYSYYNRLNNDNYNPAKLTTKPKKIERERYLTSAEIQKLLETLKTFPQHFQDFMMIELLTGKRVSNIAAMRFDWIDWDNQTYIIPATEQKSELNDISVIPQQVMQILNRRRLEVKGDWVFPSDRKAGTHIKSYRFSFQKLIQQAGLINVRQHDIRRTLGSHLAQSGASLHMIADILGQKGISATHIYARLDLDSKRQAQEAVAQKLLSYDKKTNEYRKNLELLLPTLSDEVIEKLYKIAQGL